MSTIRDQVDDAITVEGATDLDQARRVLANPRFLALFGSQILTQVGGNMVLFGLTVSVFGLTDSSTSVSILLLTFLVPAVVFGAIAGVFVDMFDRRWILISTNLARGALFLLLVFFSDQLALIYVVTAIVATLTTFFAPAEAAMIPLVVKREQLMTRQQPLHPRAPGLLRGRLRGPRPAGPDGLRAPSCSSSSWPPPTAWRGSSAGSCRRRRRARVDRPRWPRRASAVAATIVAAPRGPRATSATTTTSSGR